MTKFSELEDFQQAIITLIEAAVVVNLVRLGSKIFYDPDCKITKSASRKAFWKFFHWSRFLPIAKQNQLPNSTVLWYCHNSLNED